MEGAAHRLAQHAVGVADGVVGEGVQLGGVDLAVFAQDGFVGADVDYPSTRRQVSVS